MDKRVQLALMAAVLLGGGKYLYLNGGILPYQVEPLHVPQRGIELEQCLYAAHMAFDVHWAAACTTQVGADDSAECDLPDTKAAVVNAWLNDEEKRCMAEARGTRVSRLSAKDGPR
jgi:hypothetical protein